MTARMSFEPSRHEPITSMTFMTADKRVPFTSDKILRCNRDIQKSVRNNDICCSKSSMKIHCFQKNTNAFFDLNKQIKNQIIFYFVFLRKSSWISFLYDNTIYMIVQ